jgi:hypothetical protein
MLQNFQEGLRFSANGHTWTDRHTWTQVRGYDASEGLSSTSPQRRDSNWDLPFPRRMLWPLGHASKSGVNQEIILLNDFFCQKILATGAILFYSKLFYHFNFLKWFLSELLLWQWYKWNPNAHCHYFVKHPWIHCTYTPVNVWSAFFVSILIFLLGILNTQSVFLCDSGHRVRAHM